MFTCIFHKKRSADKFSCKKKCSKCGTVASCEYYFVEQIARTTYHRNMIDPRYKVEKLVLTDYFANLNYLTVADNSMFFQFH